MLTREKHFTVSKFHTLIDHHGVSTTWYKAITCPCRDMTTGGYNEMHDLCDGLGVIYYDPQTINVVYQGYDLSKDLAKAGIIDEAVLNATFKADAWVADGDRFIPANEYVIDDEAFERGKLKAGGGTSEKLIYRYPESLLYVVDENGLTYTPGTNLQLIADANGYIRTIQWITGAPAVGVRYSVRYRAKAEYVVFLAQPKIRIEHGTKQVTSCRLKKITNLRGEK